MTIKNSFKQLPNEKGYFGSFGGRYVSETLMPLILEVEKEYDKIKSEVLSLEKKYEFLKNENSPSKIVGYKPSKNFEKVTHKVPMLSLANAFNEVDLENFENKYIDLLKSGGSKKYDELFSPFNLNLSKKSFWKKGLNVIESYIDELETL